MSRGCAVSDENGRDESRPAPAGPVPDLGFFAGPPAASSAFGGSPQFSAPPAAPFGTPASSSPFGGPLLPAPPDRTSHASRRGWSTGWKVGAGLGVAVVLLASVLGGRFGWQQFVADPVVPETLMGMPKVAGPGSDAIPQEMTGQLRSDLTDDSEVVSALYSDGQGSGYMLVSVRGSSRPGEGSGDEEPFAGWTQSTHDGMTCSSKPAQAAEGLGVTFCMRGLWRRAVFVYGIALTPPDPATVARATAEAWDAQ